MLSSIYTLFSKKCFVRLLHNDTTVNVKIVKMSRAQ
jgi:hypothetical protein